MKNLWIAVALMISRPAFAAGMSTMNRSHISNMDKAEQVGVGIQAGTSTGVNVEYWSTQNTALTAAIAQEHSNAAITIGQNWMFRDTFSGGAAALVPYAGIGALGVFGKNSDYLDRTSANPNFVLAAQVPLGLEWLPQAQRFAVFGQLSPSAELTPVLMGFMAADVGARFYF